MTTRRPLRPPVRCLALLNRLSRYIDDELTPRQRRVIDAHCRDCARCKRMIAGLQRTVSLYRAGPCTQMPKATRARARARIAQLLDGKP
jgi:anti-sigma factor RsiW